jgi:hypothetical protein
MRNRATSTGIVAIITGLVSIVVGRSMHYQYAFRDTNYCGLLG